MRTIVLIVLLGMVGSACYAEAIPSALAERAILGEALPNYEAMHDIASAIRNRGTLKGVYGVRSSNYDKASPKLRALASMRSTAMPTVRRGSRMNCLKRSLTR